MGRLIAAAVCAGLLVGWYVTHNHYQGKMAKAERQQTDAENERREQLATLSRGYYETYQDAINREPATVDRRVYVKADCVPAGQPPRMGDAANAGGRETDSGATGSAGKVALAQSTVDAVVSVADRHQRLYDACRIKLEYFQHAYNNQQ